MKNTKTLYLLTVLLFSGIVLHSSAQNQVIPLWNKIPDEIKSADYKEKEVITDGKVQSTSLVTIPTLTAFFPAVTKPNQTAVIILPGGGYQHLAIDKEGTKVAQWFNSLGIPAFVLKYRLPSDLIMKNKNVGPLQDAQEAVRYVRQNAGKWNIDPNKIGILGFSAGGHLASTASTHYDDKVYESAYKVSARPDFSLLIYPVISMENETTHKGSQTNLLGNNPSQDLINSFSNEKKVTAQTPPAFLIHATDDTVVIPENSINYYLALKKNGVTAELHLYEKGGHGFGLGVKDTSKFWTRDCEEWLKANGYN
ncbi:alpha/beta hydrolase [Flavobacterium johnsoniae]|uniref:Esterase/lipase-like protein n=1 Tax=Flavobacterium johnsoniae (strain ATCC 17061 / DSM 2064 / JCM 8514 / BCRC 14874 / CCUG 350202 / NBRC 14942 / NCIMB 11054 / UW101) TaxID=376686 RepID=A5FBZ4_FLAJ1|nr:alpha/beta hydrolase [Flavobacterium johnsoniae]ABQ07274.1 Esterase/lipase-like protein [Flavobacterium johnsoniae UW101]OXE95636.1 alpha/beta hydrolase [Flavobacterium johnsoniae UW101]WQG80890.1 alpha/beta hydrolase [Flavobacterium johnsoniae UW101]SHL17869.1 Acetyl esterase/lipase [Flavobacterium johnsoniae]